MKALAEARRLHSLALADACPLGPAEDLEEGGTSVVAVVRQRDRAGSGGNVGEVGFRAGELVEGVEQDFGLQSLGIVV